MRVPGGDVVVTVTDATSYLRGPSVLVAHGEIAEAWWERAVIQMHRHPRRATIESGYDFS